MVRHYYGASCFRRRALALSAAAKIGTPIPISALAVRTSTEPRAIDATMSEVVPRRNSNATIAIDQNVRPRATDGVARQLNKKPVVVSAKNTRCANAVMFVNRS